MITTLLLAVTLSASPTHDDYRQGAAGALCLIAGKEALQLYTPIGSPFTATLVSGMACFIASGAYEMYQNEDAAYSNHQQNARYVGMGIGAVVTLPLDWATNKF